MLAGKQLLNLWEHKTNMVAQEDTLDNDPCKNGPPKSTHSSVVIRSLVLDIGFSLCFQKKLQLGQITDIFWQVLRC